MKPRYYFAGAYARRAELAGYAERTVAAGAGFVTSTWLTTAQDETDAGLSAGQLVTDEAVVAAWKYGRQDIADLIRSDAIVSFTGQGGRGGRHVEHGFAMAFTGDHIHGLSKWPMRLIVVGPREHVFHCHPATEVFADFEAFLKHETERGEN